MLYNVGLILPNLTIEKINYKYYSLLVWDIVYSGIYMHSYKTTQHHILENHNLHSQHCQNLKYHIINYNLILCVICPNILALRVMSLLNSPTYRNYSSPMLKLKLEPAVDPKGLNLQTVYDSAELTGGQVWRYHLRHKVAERWVWRAGTLSSFWIRATLICNTHTKHLTASCNTLKVRKSSKSYLKMQFIPHRKHKASPLQRPTSQCCSWK